MGRESWLLSLVCLPDCCVALSRGEKPLLFFLPFVIMVFPDHTHLLHLWCRGITHTEVAENDNIRWFMLV